MRDWNHDGNEDYWDDVFYFEQVERDYQFDLDSDEDDELGGGYSSSTSSYNSNTYRSTPAYQSTGVPFFLRLIIAITVISIIAAFSELLGFVGIIIWLIIEANTR